MPKLLRTLLGNAGYLQGQEPEAISHLINALLSGTKLPEVLPTDEAAAAINRAPQTLRKWACLENGPIRPVRINGRLAWRVSDLQKLLAGEVA